MSTRRLTTVSCDTPIEQVVEIIRRDGAVAISNFVSEETLKSLTEDLDSYLGVTPAAWTLTSPAPRLDVPRGSWRKATPPWKWH